MSPSERTACIIEAEGGPAMVLLLSEAVTSARYGISVAQFNSLRSRCRGMIDVMQATRAEQPRQPVALPTPRAVAPVAPVEAAASPASGRTHLVIGDAHAAPNQSLDRFVHLGRMIAALRPDVVVCIGDWADFSSLSSYDRGKRSGENARYSEDVTASNEALRLLTVNAGEAMERAERVWTVGNHEDRINRYTNDHPELDGEVGLQDLDFARRGWDVVPFLTPKTVDGVTYCHFFHKPGGTKNGIGGVNAGRAMILHALCTTVAGHSHMLHHASAVNLQGRRIHGLQVGRYDEEHHGYAGQANGHAWWSGICVLRDVRDGDFALEQVPMARIRERWGSGANV